MRTVVHHLLGLLAFQIKSLFLASTTCLSIYIGLSFGKQYENGLGNKRTKGRRNSEQFLDVGFLHRNLVPKDNLPFDNLHGHLSEGREFESLNS